MKLHKSSADEGSVVPVGNFYSNFILFMELCNESGADLCIQRHIKQCRGDEAGQSWEIGIQFLNVHGALSCNLHSIRSRDRCHHMIYHMNIS